MRDFIHLFVNGQPLQVRGAEALLILSDFLRLRLGLRGTKIVCSEGDCGSCTVLAGTGRGDRFEYKAIDSCIRFVFQLDGVHIVTVEGLGGGTNRVKSLNRVQSAMIECHGSQCGFCTPGFVVAMTGLLENSDQLSTNQWRTGLTGNLCRCTGYAPIFDAARQAQASKSRSLNEIYDAATILSQFGTTNRDAIRIQDDAGRQVFCPANLPDALKLVHQYPEATVVAGATDLGVQFNKGHIQPRAWIDLNRVGELAGIEVRGNTLIAGARASWAELDEVTSQLLPPFQKIIAVFGSPQIRQVGTIGGNIINASPISDSVPLLMVCSAQLHLASVAGSRLVDINDFHFGYKRIDLRPGELLTRIEIPVPARINQLKLYKISRRRDLDIASFTAAIILETEVSGNGKPHNGSTITSAKIAFGAVGSVVLRLKRTETFLCGKPFSEKTMRLAGDLAVEEITPISDVRGSEDYRLKLARNVLLKYFHESCRESPVPISQL